MFCKKSEYGGDYTLKPNPNKVKKSYKVKCPPCVFDFGKCRGCGKPEGKLLKSPIAKKPKDACPTTPGGIGKHRFKFGICVYCGKKQF